MRFIDRVTQLLRADHAKAEKASRAGPLVAWSSVGQPKWTPRRYDALAEEGFRKNVIAYRCVMQIATSASSVPWLLYDGDGGEADTHPLLDLLRHPNPMQDGIGFIESIYAYLEIAGNAYIEAVRPDSGGAPVELYALRPDRMKVIPGKSGLPEGYQYEVAGQVTKWPADPLTGASNILHLKTFHPLDDWYGMAPLEAALLSIDQHNAAGAWNQALLNQGARPSGALVFAPKEGPATLTDQQVLRLREELGTVYQGSRNAGRPLILEGGLDWREMSLSPKDMDWLGGRNVAARDIALAFGVPAQLIGIPDAQTYANVAEARLALYEETVLPLLTRVIAGFDHWLTPMFDENLCLDYDPDGISALAVKRDVQWTKLQNADYLTVNEKREAVGYGPLAGGDVLAPSGGKAPVAAVAGNAPPALPGFNPHRDEFGRFAVGAGDDEGAENDNEPGDDPDDGQG
ncbi:MAG TPA: phage portal protein [Alphaproteobacteria bacterium]|nr:phage portal protein [Alphaproteobacteria bacterium]